MRTNEIKRAEEKVIDRLHDKGEGQLRIFLYQMKEIFLNVDVVDRYTLSCLTTRLNDLNFAYRAETLKVNNTIDSMNLIGEMSDIVISVINGLTALYEISELRDTYIKKNSDN